MMHDDVRRTDSLATRSSRSPIVRTSTNDAISRAPRIHPSSPINPSVVPFPHHTYVPPHIPHIYTHYVTCTYTLHTLTPRASSSSLHHPTHDRARGGAGAWDSLTNDESRPITSPPVPFPRRRPRLPRPRDRGGTSSDGHFDESRVVRARGVPGAWSTLHGRPSTRSSHSHASWLPWR